MKDPYAIYAERILNLKALSSLVPQPDARLKGIVFHALMEDIFAPGKIQRRQLKLKNLHTGCCKFTFHGRMCMRIGWGHIRAISEQLVVFQKEWSENDILKVEAKGVYDVPGTAFTVTAKADRLDRTPEGSLISTTIKQAVFPQKRT